MEESLLDIAVLRWRLILLSTLGCTVLAAVATEFLPKRYGSEMEFLVKNGRQELTVSPARATVAPPPTELTEAEVNSEMQLLSSHDLLAAVVLDKGLYRPYLRHGVTTPDARSIELGVLRLSHNLEISTLRKTNIIQAKYRAHDPEAAAQVMEDLSSRFLQAHVSAHSTPGSVNFFDAELGGYRKGLEQAQQASSQFRRSSGIFNSDQQRAALVGQMEDVKGRLQNVSADTAEAEARLAALTTEQAKAPERMPTDERTAANQLTVDHLQSELAEMSNRLVALNSKYQPGDRAVTELRAEIANTEHSLAAARVQYAAERTTAVNPLHQTLTSELAETRVFVQALHARRTALTALEADYMRQLNSFDQQADTLGNLQRDQTLAEQSYTLFSQEVQEARVAQQMDKDNLANVSLIERPVASPLPIWPKAQLNLAVGALLGIFLGFLLAFLRPQGTQGAPAGVRRFTREFDSDGMPSPVAGD